MRYEFSAYIYGAIADLIQVQQVDIALLYIR